MRSQAVGDGTITHATVHITPATLVSAVDNWVDTWVSNKATLATAPNIKRDTEWEQPFGDADEANERPRVLFVGLHACGSLTPDILRALISCLSPLSGMEQSRLWTAAGAVVVGCCYNLMDPIGEPPLTFRLLRTMLIITTLY